jgi:ferredoxin
MKVRIIKEECISCGACTGICPAVFAIDDAEAWVLTQEVPLEEEEAVREAAESCPTEAIIVEE